MIQQSAPPEGRGAPVASRDVRPEVRTPSTVRAAVPQPQGKEELGQEEYTRAFREIQDRGDINELLQLIRTNPNATRGLIVTLRSQAQSGGEKAAVKTELADALEKLLGVLGLQPR
jgi:hypothetical protein